jgi:hypothetical protein
MRTRFVSRLTAIMAASFVSSAVPLPAQSIVTTPGLEFRPFVGAYIPTGAMRDNFGEAPIFGAQMAYEHKPWMHIVASVAWMDGKAKFPLHSKEVSIYQYDLGAEWALVRNISTNWQMKPFLGIGAGARTYLYSATGLNDKTCGAGYGAGGTELQHSILAVRFEARNFVNCFRSPLAGVKSRTRNDVGLTLGLAYHFR